LPPLVSGVSMNLRKVDGCFLTSMPATYPHALSTTRADALLGI